MDDPAGALENNVANEVPLSHLALVPHQQSETATAPFDRSTTTGEWVACDAGMVAARFAAHTPPCIN